MIISRKEKVQTPSVLTSENIYDILQLGTIENQLCFIIPNWRVNELGVIYCPFIMNGTPVYLKAKYLKEDLRL